jgi:hypothetical protein
MFPKRQKLIIWNYVFDIFFDLYFSDLGYQQQVKSTQTMQQTIIVTTEFKKILH